MLHLRDVDSMYIDEGLSGYSKKMVQDGVCDKQVDLLLIGFAYAVAEKLTPQEKIKRHDLLRAGALESQVRLAIEATSQWFARELGQEEPSDEKALLDFICRTGSTGVQALKKEWEGKSRSQIELAILKLTGTQTRPTSS